MALIDDLLTAVGTLTTNVAAETADIEAALAVIAGGAASPAQVQSALDAINAANSNITAEMAKIKAAVPSAP